MFGIPEDFRVNQSFNLSTIIPKDLKPRIKKKLKEVILEVELSHQIQGESIPSIINDTNNCQVIIFLNIKLKNLKEASFVAERLQEKIKPLCVIRFYDSTRELFAFAHKRLNKNDPNDIVVESIILTNPAPITVVDQQKQLLQNYIYFEMLLNKSTKLSIYFEMSIKAYIVSNQHLYSKSKGLLDSKIWFNDDEMILVYKYLKDIEKLKEQMNRVKQATDKVQINKKLKENIQRLNKKLEEK